MAGKNWHSKDRTFREVVRVPTKEKARRAHALRAKGKDVSEIADELGLSKSRIYELLRS